MRDDAASIVNALVRSHADKLKLLDLLLLSDSDKLHYGKSGNMEKVIELIGSDTAIIESINGIDFDIAGAESSLAALIGVRPADLYETLRGSGEAGELLAVRIRELELKGKLLGKHAEVEAMLQAASGELQNSIDDLSRLRRLIEAGGDGRPGN